LEQRGVPAGPINTVKDALTSDQASARQAVISVPKTSVQSGAVELLGNPLKFSQTPVTYRLPPPHFGEDTEEILAAFGIEN
jgi:formyl-CoA transferase